MRRRRRSPYFAIGVLLIATAVFHFIGGKTARTAVPVALVGALVVCVAAAYLPRRSRPAPSIPNTEVSLRRIFLNRASREEESLDPAEALGVERRKRLWALTEDKVDAILDAAIRLVKNHIQSHTVAVFFPTGDGGYRLRRCESQSAFIEKEAVIYPGVGVIGSFFKDGLKRLNLKEIPGDSMTLYYYTRGDVGVRSLIASPIVGGGVEYGVIVVDQTSTAKFTDADVDFLSAVAGLIGETVFSRCMMTEHRLQYDRLAAMSSIEKEFFRNLSRDSIVDRIMEIVPCALPCDRLTISMKNEDGTSATILAAAGADADAFVKKGFSLREKSLASVLYANNMVLRRKFSRDYYEVRYYSNEPRNTDLLSFAAVPLGVDECRGMLLAESCRENAYDESYRELLSRLSTSAGLAIEKMLVFEKANALATRDGLTGLYNHRTFQQLLSEEITRAIRYTEPLALIIADIDFFKKINDTYGHQFGDTVLKGVAGLLEKSVRTGIDTVARYGGEEFAIILVKTDDNGAAESAERIRASVASMPFRAPAGDDVRVTMSFGIAQYHKHARSLEELIARADKALYRAKLSGRNRVEIF